MESEQFAGYGSTAGGAKPYESVLPKFRRVIEFLCGPGPAPLPRGIMSGISATEIRQFANDHFYGTLPDSFTAAE